MAIKRDDPRTLEQKAADEHIQQLLAEGKFPRASPEARKKAVALVTSRAQIRALVGRLGAILGKLRRSKGMTQQDIAEALGTYRSAISRIESGKYGGLTIERFLRIYWTISQDERPIDLSGFCLILTELLAFDEGEDDG